MHTTFGVFLLTMLTHIQVGTSTNTTNDDDTLERPYFVRALRSPHFVDKTLLLKDFLARQPALITCPKKFGKTTNLDMARRFFEAPVNKTNGYPLDRKSIIYYRLFNSKTFNFSIKKVDPDFVHYHLGKHGVIHLNFASINGNTTEQIMDSITQKIVKLLQSYQYVCNREIINECVLYYQYKCDRFETVLNTTSDASLILEAFEYLIELLDIRFHKRSVMVLIDNYDHPIIHAIQVGADAEKINNFITKNFFSTFVKNDRLKRQPHVMIAGVSRLFLDEFSPPSNVDGLDANYFLGDSIDLGRHFGFNETEVHRLLTAKDIDPTQRKDVKQFFNGYKFKPHSKHAKDQPDLYLYHPENVIQYLDQHTIRYQYYPRDIVSSIMKCLRKEPFFLKFTQLLRDKVTLVDINYHMSVKDLQRYSDIVKTNCTAFKDFFLLRLTPFIDAGYLLTDGKIPNTMAENQLKRKYQDFFAETYGINLYDTEVITNLHAIHDSKVTTVEMLTNLADSLQHQLHPVQAHRIDKSQFAIIIQGFINMYTDFGEMVGIKSLNDSNAPQQDQQNDLFSLNVPNRELKTVLIVKITVAEELQKSVREIQNYAPAGKSSQSAFDTVKYLVINLNEKNHVQVAKGENRHEW